MKHALTLFLGILLIAVITPLAQFSTLAMTNHDLETSAASGWAFGLLFSFVLCAAALRLLTRNTSMDRSRVVLLFIMLTIAVPVMNLGLIRPLFLSIRAVQAHYVGLGVDTYRRSYQEQSPNWYPVVPSTEGLAFHKADRLLRLLGDERLSRQRQNAYNRILTEFALEARRIERGEDTPPETAEETAGLLQHLGLSEVERVIQTVERDVSLSAALDRLQLGEPLQERFHVLRAEGDRARETLSARIHDLDERDLYFVPSLRAGFDRGVRGRLNRLLQQLEPEQAEAILARGQALEAELAGLKALVSSIGENDRAALRRQRAEAHLSEFAQLSPEALAEIRTEFVFRSRTQERRVMYGQVASGDFPGHDLAALDDSVFRNSEERDAARERGLFANIRHISQRVSWGIWQNPLLHWSSLILLMFLFTMCLAEWLRRKWVDRENLAFPLVEIADQLIRHDFKLETADDLLHPERRATRFSAVFWVGFALGMLILLVEAAGHYGPGTPKVMAFNLTQQMFADGVLKELDKLVFVLSPILLGLFFLVSLEISFSVWVLYFIFRLSFFAIGLASQGGIRDPGHVGWASRFFPFEVEQLLGAGICFGLLMLIKAWGADKGKGPGTTYLPRRLCLAGLVLLPLGMLALVMNLGLTHIGFILLFALLLLLMTIAAARIRAETGLPMQHVTYDFARLPLSLGMAGSLGVRSLIGFMGLVFLPITLLLRLLPQQLENLELARRHRISGKLVAVATLTAFLTALVVGLFSFLILSHWHGGRFLGAGAQGQGPDASGIFSYAMWNFHFLGEQGLTSFTTPHRIRLLFVGIGAAIFGLLTFLRGRMLRFPFHPLGYLLVLFSIFHPWLSPYHKGLPPATLDGASWLWGSAFVAWLLKTLIIKYGGMNTYRAAKPGFVGLLVGSLFAVFLVNVVDLSVNLSAAGGGRQPGPAQKTFVDNPAFTPRVY